MNPGKSKDKIYIVAGARAKENSTLGVSVEKCLWLNIPLPTLHQARYPSLVGETPVQDQTRQNANLAVTARASGLKISYTEGPICTGPS